MTGKQPKEKFSLKTSQIRTILGWAYTHLIGQPSGWPFFYHRAYVVRLCHVNAKTPASILKHSLLSIEALARALDAKVAGEPVDALAEVVVNGEAIEAEIIGDEATGRVLAITAESASIESIMLKKPTPKGKGTRAAPTSKQYEFMPLRGDYCASCGISLRRNALGRIADLCYG